MNQTFRFTGGRIRSARISMLFLAALTLAIGLTSGSGLALAATALLAAVLIVGFAATFRNAYLIDGPRVGHRNGVTGAVRQWVDAGDIVLTTANYDHSGSTGVGRPTLVYWTRAGGSSGLNAALIRLTVSAADKEAVERAAVNGSLRPFAIPISMLGPEAERAFEQFSPPRRG